MWLPILMRVMHIAGVVLVVGGVVYITWYLTPALRQLGPERRDDVEALSDSRFRGGLTIGILLLVVSGVGQWVYMQPTYTAAGPIGSILIGIKVTLAVFLMALLFAQSLKLDPGGSPRLWAWVHLILIAAIIILGAAVRQVRLETLTLPEVLPPGVQ